MSANQHANLPVNKRSFNFTHKRIEDLAAPSNGRAAYRDLEQSNLQLRVTESGSKTFFVRGTVSGSPKGKRFTIGQFPALDIKTARRKAKIIAAQLTQGLTPNNNAKINIRSTTIDQMLSDYAQDNKSLKDTTPEEYKRALKQVVPDWLVMPYSEISEDMVLKRHQQHGVNRSKARANAAMRVIRLLGNYARRRYKDEQGNIIFVNNPTQILTDVKAWYILDTGKTPLKSHELKAWLDCVTNWTPSKPKWGVYRNQRDLLLLGLFSGLRLEEAASLHSDQLDLIDNTIRLPDPKNRQKNYLIPMNTPTVKLVNWRLNTFNHKFLFPSTSQKSRQYFNDPRIIIDATEKVLGKRVTFHGLRNTFVTFGERLDISPYSIKALVNHKISKNDVTGSVYLHLDTERLRDASDKIADFVIAKSKIRAQ